MSKQKISQEEAREIIKERIGSNIDFKTLRKELKGISRRAIKLIVLDMMDELKLSEIPFKDMLRKPKKATPPLNISDEGKIDVKEILENRGLIPGNCIVKYNVGKSKITMTIKEKKNNGNTTEQ